MNRIHNFETLLGKRDMESSSVSKSEEVKVDRYIRNQEHHHRKRTFKEELIGLLDKHGITYDKRYIWD